MAFPTPNVWRVDHEPASYLGHRLETFARLEVPIDGTVAWEIFQKAVAEAVNPRITINLQPEDFTR